MYDNITDIVNKSYRNSYWTETHHFHPNIFPVDFVGIPSDEFVDVNSVATENLSGRKILRLNEKGLDRSYFYKYLSYGEIDTLVLEEGVEFICAGTIPRELSGRLRRIVFPSTIKRIGTMAISDSYSSPILEFRALNTPIVKRPVLASGSVEIIIPKGSLKRNTQNYSEITWGELHSVLTKYKQMDMG